VERRELEHKEALKEVARMKELARGVREELEENKQHVLSLKTLERLEEIERLSKDVRARLRR
jgi:hypothetical protein